MTINRGGAVTIKMKRIVAGRQMLGYLMGTPLPASLSLRLSRLARAADAELEAFDIERIRLAKDLGETKDGQQFTFSVPEKREEFERQMEAMGEEEVQLPPVTLTIKELGEREFPPALFSTLNWLFPEVHSDGEEETHAVAAGGQTD